MRRLLIAAACGLVLGVAGAAGNDDNSPETRAYVGLSFGGSKTLQHELHYGLRFDQGSRLFGADQRPATSLMQLDFTRAGLNAASLNGMPILKRSYRLQQTDTGVAAEPTPDQTPPAEESAPADSSTDSGAAESAPAESAPADSAAAAEAPEAVEEQGFFGRIGSWFGGLFGGDDEEETEEVAADTGEETAEGTFMGYDTVDWATLAVGAVGLGYVVSQVANGDDDSDPSAGGGGTPEEPCATDPLCPPSGTLLPGGGTLLPVPLRGSDSFLPTASNRDPAYQEWLDGGSGHMGDLGVAQ